MHVNGNRIKKKLAIIMGIIENNFITVHLIFPTQSHIDCSFSANTCRLCVRWNRQCKFLYLKAQLHSSTHWNND